MSCLKQRVRVAETWADGPRPGAPIYREEGYGHPSTSSSRHAFEGGMKTTFAYWLHVP